MNKKNRLLPLDLLRGTLIILMALDHANYHIAQQHSSGEYWGGVFPVFPSTLHFLTRFVTHVCAPGFFFLMGVSMALFASSRRKKGWDEMEIRAHFLLRGLVLIVMQQALNFSQIWSTSGSTSPLWYVGVLAALGAAMILVIPILNLHPSYLGIVAGGLFLLLELFAPDLAQWGLNFDQLLGVLLIYGGGQGNFWVNYPLLAWLEIVVFGLLFGKLILADEKKAFRTAGRLGSFFLVSFVIVRNLNGFGNIRTLPTDSWTGFLSVVKYPPSMAYVLLTMGVNLILLRIFSGLGRVWLGDKNPVLVFGRTALFSYVSHIVIYILLGRLLVPAGTSLGVMYLLWLVGLGVLYWPAYWFGLFKSGQPSRSWVRFL
ncbi:MAG: heparan-alpha-glucosaminide N-acetyltransferase domain-containing protein [Anaerolineales bacterium]